MDNFPLFFREGSRRKRFFEAMERRMFRAAGIVFASSEGLFKKCRKCHSRVYLVRNAVDLNHFSSVNANQQLPCDDKANPNRPVVGYVGTIGEWIDLDLVARLALENPTWAVVMVGPVHTKVSHLLDIPNLYFLGPVAYDEVPSYIGRFDVCIMPFKVNALTRDVNPVKMYEYLAAGKPVVSTCLPEVEQFGYVCMVSKTADEFIQNVHQALLENSLSETQRQQLQESRISVAPSNSWDIRVQSILDVVEQCFENRNPYLS
jgi:glycosyltransferase involved in cell wall biosynthesis